MLILPERGNGLQALLDQPGWHRDEAALKVLKPILLRLCATYLTEAKAGKRARDPVAHFPSVQWRPHGAAELAGRYIG